MNPIKYAILAPLRVLTQRSKRPYVTFMKLTRAVREALVELGRIGGKKGGPKGGKARAARMTAKERSESARKAVLVRWARVRAKKRAEG